MTMTVLGIKRKYKNRILAILNRIAEVLRQAGCDVEGPWDLSGDDYRWELQANNIDISITICESETYDGEPNGINFALDIVEEGGRILGGLTPYNYTDAVWVSRSDSEA